MKNKKTTSQIEKILKDFDLYKIPVDIVALANKLDISIFQQELDYDGAIISNKKGFKIDDEIFHKAIFININQGPARKRFTIAHELAHWFTASDEEKENLFAHREDNIHSFNTEPEINNFASELLMPYGLLKKVIPDQNPDLLTPSLIYLIADVFNVSYPAAQVRLEKYFRGV